MAVGELFSVLAVKRSTMDSVGMTEKAAITEKPTFAELIKNPGFRYLWINQILVQLAYNTLNFTLLIWVFKLTDSVFANSALLIAMYLPAVLFGIFSGVFTDVADRRRVIIRIDLLLAVATLLFIFIKGSFPLILLNVFFINTLAQFFIPAEGSSIPMVVPKRQLLLANSLFSLTFYGSFMIGFSIAGPILNFFGIDTIFYIGTGLLIIAFLVAQFLPSIRNEHWQTFGKFFSLKNFDRMVVETFFQSKQTFHFIHKNLAVLFAIVLLSMIQGVIGVLAVIISPYMERVLHIHATDASYILMIPLGLGMLSGVVLLGKWGHKKPRRSIVIPSVLAAGIVFILAGLLPWLGQVFQAADFMDRIPRPRYFFRTPSLSGSFAVCAYLLGVAAVSIIVTAQTVLQENTEEQNRGKIFAVLGVMMSALSLIPIILAGFLADIFGPAAIFIWVGLIIVIIGLVGLRPHLFFEKNHLPYRVREFLGLGHWD